MRCSMWGPPARLLWASIARHTGPSLTNCGRAPTILIHVTAGRLVLDPIASVNGFPPVVAATSFQLIQKISISCGARGTQHRCVVPSKCEDAPDNFAARDAIQKPC